jgi:hypothetical protein
MPSPSRANGPLERRRDWVLGIVGLIAFGIGGYLLDGTVGSWPLLVALVAFVGAVIQRYRHTR